MQFLDPLRGRVGCFQIIEDVSRVDLYEAHAERFDRLRSCFELIQSAEIDAMPTKMLQNYLWSMQVLAEEINMIARRMARPVEAVGGVQ